VTGPLGPVTPSPPPPSYHAVGAVPPPAAKRRSWLIILLIPVALVLVISLVTALILRLFVVQTFFIPSGSMEPTLKIGDRIVVDKLSYRHSGAKAGDIVVFARPPAENCGGGDVADLVKRVIALPGQTISLADGNVFINGRPQREPWLPAPVRSTTLAGPAGTSYNLQKPFVVPSDDYFVMGDNRTESCDSRYWGPISKSLIVGKVVVRIWPLGDFHIF
jgi:signal peptidase I